jgi:hypothetical protein
LIEYSDFVQVRIRATASVHSSLTTFIPQQEEGKKMTLYITSNNRAIALKKGQPRY